MYAQILVPLDRSEKAERALYHAKALAGSFNSAVHLLHIVTRDDELETMRGGGNAQMMELTRNLGRRVRASKIDGGTEYLNRMADRLHREGISVATGVREGEPADRIVEYALQQTIDLIIMCSRGAGGIRRIVSGSITDRVIRASHLPVLVVPLE